VKSINARLCSVILPLAFTGMALHAQAVSAQAFDSPTANRPVDELTIAELKNVFWTCDLDAAYYGADFGDGSTCVQATERLQREYFESDFDSMLQWWLDNRELQHARLEAKVIASYDAEELQTP
jgi:hypothetical protein